jgi:competence protein ComEC
LAFGYLLGCLTALASAAPPTVVWRCVALAAAALLALRAALAASPRPRQWLVIGWLGGFALASFAAASWLELRVDQSEEGDRWLIRATIESVPARRGDESTFDAEIAVLAPRGQSALPARRLRIAWRSAAHAPAVGETWQWLVEVSARPPRSGAVDLERLWLRDRIHGGARVLPSRLNTRLGAAPHSIDALRARIARNIEARVVDHDAGALLRALAVGLTEQMRREQWRVFNATGTTHLVAISGMHVTLFAWVAFALARASWRWLPGINARLDREPFALLVGVTASGAYALLAGFSVPTQRTLLMLATFAVVRMLHRFVPLSRTVAIALLVVLLLDPLAPLGAGFWLSFVAVAAIVLSVSGRLRRRGAAAAALSVQFAVLFALTPISFATFGSVSLASLAVNVIAIPLVSFVLVPLTLVGALATLVWPTLAAVALGVAESVYEFGWPWLAAAADWRFALIGSSPHRLWYLLGAIACLLAVLPLHWRLRLTSLAALVSLFAAGAPAVPHGAARVTVVDTGRGSLAVIETTQHTLLYDTGDSYQTAGRFVDSVIRPRLTQGSRRALDIVILPRLSQDRAAGVGRLVAAVSVGAVRGGGVWHGAKLNYSPCRDGETWLFDGVRFELTIGADAEREYCALRIASGDAALLFATDFNALAERDWLRRLRSRGALTTSQAVLIPRRASGTASSPEWIAALRARIAIATGPAAARVSSPRGRTLERWRGSGATVIETAQTGDVELLLTPEVGVDARGNSATAYPFLWKSSR